MQEWIEALLGPEALGTAAAPANRYRPLGLLGKGASGAVLEVHDRHLKRSVAMKVLFQQSASTALRFRSEAQATAQLQHPNIIPVFDLGQLHNGHWYFTMPKVAGSTLRDRIRDVHSVSQERWRATPTGWSLRRVVEALRSVCGAVAHAHDKGVTHRDLKPTNIMVGRFGEVLVVDWGIARVIGAHHPFEGPVTTAKTEAGGFTTQRGVIAGSPGFMSPEQAAGDIELIGPRTDVYGLGGLLYAILADRPPFVGARSARQVLLGPPEPPRGTGAAPPEPLSRLAMKALATDPDDRQETALDFAHGLTTWLEA